MPGWLCVLVSARARPRLPATPGGPATHTWGNSPAPPLCWSPRAPLPGPYSPQKVQSPPGREFSCGGAPWLLPLSASLVCSSLTLVTGLPGQRGGAGGSVRSPLDTQAVKARVPDEDTGSQDGGDRTAPASCLAARTRPQQHRVCSLCAGNFVKRQRADINAEDHRHVDRSPPSRRVQSKP